MANSRPARIILKLANVYLNPLDHLMAARGRELVRYADDFVILCRTEAEAIEALREVEQWTQAAGLTLHPTKTRIVHAVKDGFDFLGYRFERGQHWPRKKSLQNLKETIRTLTRRNNGTRLAQIIERVNRTLRGWYEYFKHSNRWTFKPLRGWIRMRAAQHPAASCRQTRTRPWERSPTLEQCLL